MSSLRPQNQPLRVLHAAETIKGGVATVMRQLVTDQSSTYGSANIRVLVPHNHVAELQTLAPAQIHTFNRTGRNPLSLLAFTAAFVRQVWCFKPHIVHIHSTFAGVLGRAALLALLPFRRPRVVYCPHAWSFIMDGSPTRKKLYAGMEKILYPFTDAIICGSLFEKNEAIGQRLSTGKLSVIYNGVEPPATTPAPSPYRQKSHNLLFVGRFDHQKGFDIMLEAMRQLEESQWHLTAVGDTVHATEKPPQRANITYTGWLKPYQLAPYFQHADVVVMPSRWESFGLVAAEAASYARPVVASKCASLPEIVLHGQTGFLFPTGDADALTAILQKTPLTAWRELGRAGYEHYLANFTTEAMVVNTRKLYGKR